MSKQTKIVNWESKLEQSSIQMESLKDNLELLVIRLFIAGEFDNILYLFVGIVTLVDKLINAETNYFTTNYKPKRKLFGRIKNYNIPTFDYILEDTDNITQFCQNFGYENLSNVYKILLTRQTKVTSLINDVKEMYVDFGNDISSKHFKLVWNNDKNRFVLEHNEVVV